MEKTEREKKKKEELTYTGIPISPGIVIGKAVVSKDSSLAISEETIPPRRVREEFEWAKQATVEVIEELEEAKESVMDKVKPLVESEIMILKDPTFLEKVGDLIKGQKHRADFSIFKVLTEMADSMEKRGESPYMRERASDLRLLARSLVQKIQRKEKTAFRKPQEEKIFFAREISIPEALNLIKSGFKGIVLEGGGRTSHAAIILRDYQVPAVFGLGKATEAITDGDQVALDGGKGTLVVNPKSKTLKAFRERIKAYENFTKELMRLKDISPKTKDGFEINLLGNIDFEEEIRVLKRYGTYGIGLFRTEILFLTNRVDEEIQRKIYLRIAESVYPNSVVFRAYDIGGDKVLRIREANPFLGLRGIRVLLAKKDLFREQIRAIMRANIKGNVSFMIPMVSTVEEIKETLDLMKHCHDELMKEDINVPFPRFGVMIETPSAALMIKDFCPYIDFVSIGTNDLTQYLLAVDRRNPRVSYLYDHLHPSVLRLLCMAVEDSKEAGVKISVCGELASDPMGVPLLIGMGVNELSVTPVVLLETKELIMGIEKREAKELLSKSLEASSTREVRTIVSEFLSKRFPHIVMFRPL